jgi:hypothetical protein
MKKKKIEKVDYFIDKKSKPITEILKRIIASGFIKNARPLSCLLIAPVGAGKTTTLLKFSTNKNIMALSDVTPYGLTKLLSEIKMKGIKHLIIYDLVEPMSRGRASVNNLIGFFNSLIEEGIFKISTAFIEVKEPINLGLITCTTEKEMKDKRRGWLGIGFISRLIPISFDYTSTDIIQILEDLAKQKIRDISFEELKIKEKDIKENETIFNQLIPYAQDMILEGELPFRKLEQLKILLMSNALLRNDDKVIQEDFDWFKSIVTYLNYDLHHL